MEYRNLGQSGLKVSTLCLGAMTFGEADEKSMMHKVGCDEDTSHQLIERALEAGINFFDTANIYGQDGLSERVIGAWFDKSGRRDELVLATKFRFRTSPGPLGAGASRRHIVRACEDSLRRLRTDRIDLYQIHMQDNDTPEEETLRALDDLVRQGKVLYLGASHPASRNCCRSARRAAAWLVATPTRVRATRPPRPATSAGATAVRRSRGKVADAAGKSGIIDTATGAAHHPTAAPSSAGTVSSWASSARLRGRCPTRASAA